MIVKGKRYVVMGLLDADSLAYTIGRTIAGMGGEVVFTVQNELFKRRFLDAGDALTLQERDALNLSFCDVTKADEVHALFKKLTPLEGVVHSIAYANPRTCLGEEFHTDAVDDILASHHISCVSLATVAQHAVPAMPEGGSIVTLSFDTSHVYPYYNWMGVQKAGLEALVRALARRHGRDGVRCNAVSAGPLSTKAAGKIPGFGGLTAVWDEGSFLSWNTQKDKQSVANAVVFLLGPYAAKITGQVITVDGGASICGGRLLDHEKRPGTLP